MQINTQQINKQVTRTLLLNPGPATTSTAVKSAMLVSDICPREHNFGDLMHGICNGIKEIAHVKDTHEVALFVASGTGVMEATLISALSPTDCVLILTNGAYGFRMQEICQAYLIAHDTMLAFGEWPHLENFENALKSGKYTHVAVIHHETSTGMLNPIEAISKICQKYHASLIVDAMSSFGAYPLDLSETRIDFLFSSSNKCIHGMPGLSFLIFHRDQLDKLKQNSRGYYFDVYKQWHNLQTKNQLRFTPPVQVCYAFKAAIDETLQEGVNARWQRYRANWKLLYEGFRSLGFSFYLPDDQQSEILLAVDLASKPELDFNHFHDSLFAKGITIYPGVIPETKTFRVAVIGDLYEADLQFVIESIRSYFKAS